MGPVDGTTVVRPAGCVLWAPRRAPATVSMSAGLEPWLAHRPKCGGWSRPKGKPEPGEGPLAGALREVAQETGYAVVPGTELPAVRHPAHGRPGEARYWAAAARTGTSTPSGEVGSPRTAGS
ncbi:NUDIX domain-containing protein [Streptomyces sp. NPDC048392]|uniref:NUDIX domain-containing protein n=1 Tax=Streptomyces sp. NPDC048392 TaxID=3365543 RepID=UPI003715B6A4